MPRTVKLIISRLLPAEGQELLDKTAASGTAVVVQWKKETAAERTWILAELRKGGFTGILCMLGDKVSNVTFPLEVESRAQKGRISLVDVPFANTGWELEP